MTMLLLLAAAAAMAHPSELKTFKDWTVGCDNGRACHMTSLMPEDGDWDSPVTLSLERDPAANAPVKVTLMPGPDAVAGFVVIGGKRLALRGKQASGDYVFDAAGATEVIKAIRNQPSIEVLDRKGTSLGAISLAGASAALLYIDDAQKRTGTVTALARPGSAAAATVPPPPSLPTVRSAAVAGAKEIAISAAQMAKVRKDHQCIPEQKDWPGYDVETHAIDANHTLILMGCGAGAYNYSSVPLIATRTRTGIDVKVAQFDLKQSQGDSGDPLLVNADWVPTDGTLTEFAKGRGIGDCGTGNDYAWDGGRFRLVNQITMGECRGSMDYITTWRAKVVR